GAAPGQVAAESPEAEAEKSMGATLTLKPGQVDNGCCRRPGVIAAWIRPGYVSWTPFRLRSTELRWWVVAWSANTASLLITGASSGAGNSPRVRRIPSNEGPTTNSSTR